MPPIKYPGICRGGTAFGILLVGLAYSYVLFAAPRASGQETKMELPKEKQTTLGLYLTAAEAYKKWKAAPDAVKVIDVRTPEEYAFVGHAEMAWNIPVAFVTYQRKDGKTEYGARPNPDFVAEVKKLVQPTDTLLLMCRSGGRSAMAVNQLAAAGFMDVYNITDGFEGDKVKDSGSVFFGKRMRNGWKNSVPWTYGIDPEKLILSEGSSKQATAEQPQ
jgi:rhodanese-related sulfurtransferase